MVAFRYILIQTIICLLFANSIIVRAQESDSIYFESPALFKCILQFPKDYNPDNFFPLLISLHGGGSSYKDFKDIRKHFENPEFIIATPQAPYKWLMGDKIAYDWSAWPTGDLMFMQKALKLTSNSIKNLVHSITDQYNISEVYIMGFSQGSIITQIAGINHHDLLDGLIILSGPEINHPGKPEIVWPAEETIRSANHLGLFIAHGKSDEIVDVEFAYKSKVQYEKNGYDVSLFEFEGGHQINTEAMKEIEKWIENQ
jgi:phospholipase/carboxylesterase